MSQDTGDNPQVFDARACQRHAWSSPPLFVEHQSPAEVAARYGVHRAWVYRLRARYEAEGEAALEPRSRRPKTSPNALDPAVVAVILDLRDKLSSAGLDAGPETIAWHLASTTA